MAGSAYLSLDHWAYAFLDVLSARGALPELPLLARPWRRLDVARALRAALDGDRLAGAEVGWARDVLADLAHEERVAAGPADPGLRFGGEAAAGGKALTQLHRDVLRPAGDGRAFVLLDLYLVTDAPLLAAGFRMQWDNHFLNDPQFPGGQVTEPRQCDPIVAECGYRVQEAYVELQAPYARLFFGRMNRNWGLPGQHGLLISAYPYSYEHLGYVFGTERLSLRGLVALPNDFLGDTARFFTSHRLDWRIRDNLQLGFAESVIYGGPDARFDLNIANPLGIWHVSGSPAAGERNELATGEVWWRPLGGVVLYGALLIDNTLVGEPGEKSGLTQWASAFGVQLPAVRPGLAVRADLSLINSLAYRSRIGTVEYYALEGIGLGPDKVDVVLLRLQADWFPVARLALRPQLQVQWKGEDDLNDPFPADAFTTHPDLLAGTIATTVRPAVGGRWRIGPADVEWDWGVNLVSNLGHMPGASDTRLEGRIQAVIRKSFLN